MYSRCASGLGDVPGVSTSTYAAWSSAVKAAGGAVTVLPGTSTPAARYPAALYVPHVNAHEWPVPAAYSRDGQFAYYEAPPAVVIFVATGGLTTPTDAEVAAGAKALRDDWFGDAEQLLVTIGKFGAIAAVLYFFGPAMRRAMAGRRA